MRVLVTGANGFIAKNLIVRLNELNIFDVVLLYRETSEEHLSELVKGVDAIVHLAGVNRPKEVEEFNTGNAGFTGKLCEHLVNSGQSIPIIFASSTQAAQENDYGLSKAAAEIKLRSYAKAMDTSVYIYRLPNVFGKWCKPNYNSVVATFCYNIARNLPINICEPETQLTLIHIDDVINEFVRVLKEFPPIGPDSNCLIPVSYSTSVGEISAKLYSFKRGRETLMVDQVGNGLMRALYSTYVSYLPKETFSYEIPSYSDDRGMFVEMLKTSDSGQFSFFSAHPGITRGGHYHHTKTEKFLVLKGKARFGFRNIQTSETHELFTSGEVAEVVETVPGWSHDITNVGKDEMIVMLWANEVFDRSNPDTITHTV